MSTRTVYRSTWRPRKYHASANCNGLNSTALAGDHIEPIPHRLAVADGLEPCRTCQPPAALTETAPPPPPDALGGAGNEERHG